MSEVKTTKEIRELFTDGGFFSSKEFDRWLEQHDAEVVKATEERIIKLLEEQNNDEMSFEYQNYLIELIKGENATDFTGSTLPISQEGENK